MKLTIMNDEYRYFICLFAIHMSSLVKCLFKAVGHSLNGLFVFLLLSLENSLHVLDVGLANISPQSVAFLLILVTQFAI